jgi:DNA-binding response OmpR family regulator
MTTSKQILVVDDHFEMLEFLRSMLTIAYPDCQVVSAPSAEEGFLELRRTPFDLLITDVRLPGISGFELVRRVRQVRPETPIIMITAYSSPQGKEEAEQLGVFRYFQKPLNTDALLAAVKTALQRGEPPAAPAVAAPASAAAAPLDSAVQARLKALRADTGATEVALVSNDGQIVFHLGDGLDAHSGRLAPLTARAMRAGFQLAGELQNDEPLMIQYQAGSRFDLYTANVGTGYFVMLLFSVRERRGRIGTIWVFAQRAISELKAMLPDALAAPPSPAPARDMVATSQTPEVTEPEQLSPPDASEVAPAAPADQVALAEDPGGVVTDEAAAEAIEQVTSELAELLTAADLAETGRVDLDAYWEDLVDNHDSGPREGLSFDEAIQRGLLPPQFGDEAD